MFGVHLGTSRPFLGPKVETFGDLSPMEGPIREQLELASPVDWSAKVQTCNDLPKKHTPGRLYVGKQRGLAFTNRRELCRLRSPERQRTP